VSAVLTALGVGLLGALGAVARFLVDRAVSRRSRGGLPWGTLVVNLTGTFALGLLAGAGVGDPFALLAGTATLGSYTTFSTWMFESHRLAEDGRGSLVLLNLAVGLASGLVAATAGWTLGGWWGR
jgi:CrcB protein